jgi:uncharacterized protein
MRIAITGATGLIGSALVPFFLREKHQVVQITRPGRSARGPTTEFIAWSPEQRQLDPHLMEGFDVVIHLAGANVGEPWTVSHKRAILDSRINGTRLLCQTLSKLKQKPAVLLSASAVGFYGNQPEDVLLYEQSPKGQGFLADICYRWEEETAPAHEAGIRVVRMRFGVVLSKRGGALAKMWLPFKMGLGGVLGSGEQMMSWVALDEIPFIIKHMIERSNLDGPVNVVSPYPVSNREFTRTLGQVIHRPVIVRVPEFAVQFLFGEMGQDLLLEGSRVMPQRLLDTGYLFHFADVKPALEKVTA